MLDSTDNFVEYGTPLEPLEEDEVPSKKPVSVQDQIAVDDQGRRRFHGAFTGGFSAGYYNTVGSKEGWTPKEFKSSRQNRAESSTARTAQNVQDYMDEEDLGAFGIAPQILRATTDFEQRETRKRARPAADSGPIPGIPVLEQIIQPVKDTIGIRILQRMGWRTGQGIGPRLSKAERKLEREKRQEKKRLKDKSLPKPLEDEPVKVKVEVEDPGVKVYGCFVPEEFRKAQEEESDSDDSIVDMSQVTFAPDDFEDPLCNPKENVFGLGYTGLDRSALSFGAIDLFGADAGIKTRVENRKLNIRGEAFGIGAFEDADMEVYNRSDMSQYDFSLETPEERKERRGKERRDKSDRNSAKSESGVLTGFSKAKKPPPLRKYFAPPPLPKNFEPKHYIRQSRFDQPPPAAVEDGTKKKLGLDRHRLTIEERQVLLGEQKVPLTPQEQLALEAKAKEEEEKAKAELALEKAERLKKFTEVLQTYTSNKAVASSESGAGFKPFMKNPEKQERYEKYMTLCAAGFKESLKDLQPPEMTEWERERERMEFERASALYRPMGNVISSRFVSAQSHDISHLVPMKEIVAEKDPTQDPKVAAKMGLFGKLTHKVFEWHPDRLLSKRFNVPHPHPDSKMIGVVRRDAVPRGNSASTEPAPEPAKIVPLQPPVKKSLFDNIDFSKPPPGLLPLPPGGVAAEGEPPAPGTEEEGNKQSGGSPLETDSVKAEPQPPAAPTKPPIDLFKEIFENSSSEESDEEDQKPPPQTQPLSTPTPKSTRFESTDSKLRRENFSDGNASQNNTDTKDAAEMSTKPRNETSHRENSSKIRESDSRRPNGGRDHEIDSKRSSDSRHRGSDRYFSGAEKRESDGKHSSNSSRRHRSRSRDRNNSKSENRKSEENNSRSENRKTEKPADSQPKSKGIFDNLDLSKLDSAPLRVKAEAFFSRNEKATTANESGELSDADEEDDIYGPLPPRRCSNSIFPVKSTVSKGRAPRGESRDGALSQSGRGNPITSNSGVSEGDELWVEVEKSGHREKSKKLKRGSHSSKSKKSKRRKTSKGKKSKKHKRAPQSSASSSAGSESDSDSAIEIHQSLNNKALLSKLREITGSK